MKNSIFIDSTPSLENTWNIDKKTPPKIQLALMRMEYNCMIKEIAENIPNIPIGMLKFNKNEHDFGDYYDIEIVYEELNDSELTAAFMIEDHNIDYWSEESIKELSKPSEKLDGKCYFDYVPLVKR